LKIIFIAGSLEYGLDGVGDYTRRLAGELNRQGHLVKVMGIYDKKVLTLTEELQDIEGTPVSVYRIPAILPERRRIAHAITFIKSFNPEWLSLQYVPYSFHDKGLPLLLGYRLRRLGHGKKWHIMFHELWVGNETLKNSMLSLVQKRLIKNLLHCLKPAVVHTHLPLYSHQLSKLHRAVKELPLFSNIPFAETNVKKLSNKFTIGFFSQATASKQICSFIGEFYQQLIEVDKETKILFIGGSEVKMKEIGNIIEQIPGLENKVSYTGFLTQEEISFYLQTCDLGITSLPLFTLGKSGSVAAFLAHQIPVAVPDSNSIYLPFEKPFFDVEICKALLLKPDLSKLPAAKNAAIFANKSANLQKIATKFLSDLT
jgi:hypothetical protein